MANHLPESSACRFGCGHTDAPQKLRRHYGEKHAKLYTRYLEEKRAARAVAEQEAPESGDDAEATFLFQMTGEFNAAQDTLDADALGRVIAYLEQRFGPAWAA